MWWHGRAACQRWRMNRSVWCPFARRYLYLAELPWYAELSRRSDRPRIWQKARKSLSAEAAMNATVPSLQVNMSCGATTEWAFPVGRGTLPLTPNCPIWMDASDTEQSNIEMSTCEPSPVFCRPSSAACTQQHGRKQRAPGTPPPQPRSWGTDWCQGVRMPDGVVEQGQRQPPGRNQLDNDMERRRTANSIGPNATCYVVAKTGSNYR